MSDVRYPPLERLHIGRSWSGTRLEDDCPCSKAPCGLVDGGTIAVGSPRCPEHSYEAAKTMRQLHEAKDCPAAQPPAALVADGDAGEGGGRA